MMVSTLLYGVKKMGLNENTLNEIEQEMVCYLIDVDDMYYTMLCEPLVTRYKSAMAPNIKDIEGLEKISLVSGLVCKEDNFGSMELIDTQQQIEFPKRRFQPLRPATLEDEIAEDSSYSE